MDKSDLLQELTEARDMLNSAIATVKNGDMFATGSHYRGALDTLNRIGE